MQRGRDGNVFMAFIRRKRQLSPSKMLPLDMTPFTLSLVLIDFKPDTYYSVIHYCYNSVLLITRQLESDGDCLVPPTTDLRDFVISLRSLINPIKRILTCAFYVGYNISVQCNNIFTENPRLIHYKKVHSMLI